LTPERSRLDHLASLVGELGVGHFALELDCGNGQLTRRLAPLCDRILAVDASAAAIDAAADVTDHAAIEWRVGRLPDGVRREDGPFHLIVMAEMGYYFEPGALSALVRHLTDCAADCSTMVLCHWTGSSADHRLHASDVHSIAGQTLRALRWQPTRSYEHASHLVEVWTRCG
jgi:cyclopropane fatty-acyl-phospholipid synthase-like methyltransferase